MRPGLLLRLGLISPIEIAMRQRDQLTAWKPPTAAVPPFLAGSLVVGLVLTLICCRFIQAQTAPEGPCLLLAFCLVMYRFFVALVDMSACVAYSSAHCHSHGREVRSVRSSATSGLRPGRGKQALSSKFFDGARKGHWVAGACRLFD